MKRMKRTRRNKNQCGGEGEGVTLSNALKMPTAMNMASSEMNIKMPTAPKGIISEATAYINDTMGDIIATRVNPMLQKAIEMQLCKCDQKTLNMIGPEMEKLKIKAREILSKFAGEVNEFSVRLILNLMKAIPFLGIVIVGVQELIGTAVTAENAKGVYDKLMGYVHNISAKVQQIKAAQQMAATNIQRGGGKNRKLRNHEQILERTINSMKEFDETTHSPLNIHIRCNTKKRRK